MSFRKHPAIATLCALSLAVQPLLATAAELPELGDSSAQVLSVQAERQLGDRTMNQLRGSGAILSDPEVNAYLQSLGQRLVASDSAIAPQGFEFFAVADNRINAFALPGGHIGVNIGLILATRSESELASVLAHEISHVSQRHIARQMEAQAGNQLALIAAMLAGVIAASSGNGEVANAAIVGATAGHAQAQLNYTRAHEREADRLGFELLQKAGFDTSAMASFFARMQQLTTILDSDAPGYLRSHPLTPERIAEAQDRALAAPYRQLADSIEFQLVQALLESYQAEPEQAVSRARERLAKAPASAAPAARYGLAAALLRTRDFDATLAQVKALDEAGVRHPMIEALAGQALQQAGRFDPAIARYRAALQLYPGHRQLIEDYPRALLRAGRHAEAADFSRTQLSIRQGDAELQLVAAEANAGLGRWLNSHYHQGEAYAAMGNLPAAVEQWQIALKQPGGDDIARQIAESRLREVRNQLRAQKTRGQSPEPPAEARSQGWSGEALPRFTSR